MLKPIFSYFLVIFLLSLKPLCSQQGYPGPGLAIKAAPLTLLSPYTGPSCRLGIEYKLNGKWAMYHEAGYFFVYPGFISKNELKRYYGNSTDGYNFYWSVELSYKYQAYTTSDSIYATPDYSKDYSVTKHVECATVKVGNMFYYRSGFFFDAFFGAGLRYRQINNTLTANENDHMIHDGDLGTNIIVSRASNNLLPNIDWGVKIGYRFK